MTAEIRYLTGLGHGMTMQEPDFGYDYFQHYVHEVRPAQIVNTFTTNDFNALGIDRVVQIISRTSDEAVIRFFAGDAEVITVRGDRQGVGQFTDEDIEMIMDGSVSWLERGWSIYGTSRGDSLIGYIEDDATMFGGRGGDTLAGGWGADTLYGGSGNDRIEGGDTFPAGFTDDLDRLFGGIGADTINGGEDADLLDGGAGRDNLSGDKGSDTLTGGAGRDRFVFISYDGTDRITDFTTADDAIVFADGITQQSLRIIEVEGGVQVRAGYSLTIILEGADLADVLANGHFIFG
jgi:Ca2+-binding RTX toxin-like protein